MFVAIVLILISSVPLAVLGESSQHWTYPLFALQGVGIAILLNTATSLISDVIGKDSDNSAFVYGVYSFCDKVANGILLLIMVEYYSKNTTALKWIMSLVPILCATIAFICTYIGAKFFSDKLAKITGVA